MKNPHGRQQIRAFSIIVAVMLAFLLTGCGGGGGGSDTSAGGSSGSSTGTVGGITGGGSTGGDGSSGGTGSGSSSGWSTLTRIGNSLGSGYDLYGPNLASNDSGTVLTAWVESYNGTVTDLPSVWINLYEGGSWGTAFQLSPDYGSGPDVALNGKGDGVVAYIEPTIGAFNTEDDVLWARRYVNGAWLPPERISHDPAGIPGMYVIESRVGMDANGNIIALWRQIDNTGTGYNGVFVSRFDGTGWSTPERLDALFDAYAEALALAVSSNGTAVALWIEPTYPYDPNQSGGGPRLARVRASVYSGGTWHASGAIGDPALSGYDGESRAQISINAAGDAAAVWEEHSSTHGYRIMVSRYSALTASWMPAAPVAVSADYMTWPDVVIDRNGNIAAGWYANDPANGKADGRMNYYDYVANAWTGELAYEETDDDISKGPQLGADASGNIYVAWLQGSSDVTVSYAALNTRTYVPGSGFAAQTAPGSGYDFTMGVNDTGQIALLSLRTIYSSSPLGFFDAAWAAIFTP